MEVEYRCHRQAQEGCWDGGEEEGNGEMLTAKGQGFVWLLTASLPGADISDQSCANVSWSLNPPGSGVCRDPAPVPPCTASSSHAPTNPIPASCLSVHHSACKVFHHPSPAPEDSRAWKVPHYQGGGKKRVKGRAE